MKTLLTTLIIVFTSVVSPVFSNEPLNRPSFGTEKLTDNSENTQLEHLELLLDSISNESKTTKIESAFGLKLGGIFKGELILHKKNTDGYPLYEFEPKNPMAIFFDYYVIVTPKTNTIVEIWAVGAGYGGRCSKQRKIIQVSLDKKYLELKSPYSNLMDRGIYNKGDRQIILECGGNDFNLGDLNLRYKDFKLLELYALEEAESQNTDGL